MKKFLEVVLRILLGFTFAIVALAGSYLLLGFIVETFGVLVGLIVLFASAVLLLSYAIWKDVKDL